MSGNVSAVQMRGVRVGAVLLAAGFALAACGSSSSGGSPAAGASTPPVASTTAASGSGGSLSASSFCGIAKAEQAQATKEEQQITADTPAQLATFIQQVTAQLQSFTSSAPSEIKADVQVAAAADEKIFAALKKAKYNYRNVSPTALQSIDTPAVTKASSAIGAYLESKCGISPSSAPTS
jgi:hypothetical protein